MKKKILLPILIIMVCIIVYFIWSQPSGNTIESREQILNNEVAKGNNWTISKEVEIEGYIISGAYSADNKSTLAIFKPISNNKYKFVKSINCNNDEIIISRAIINNNNYDLIWFNGAKTQYAEIIYTIDGQIQDTLKYNTTDMDIIYNKNPEKEYTINVRYYDNKGNKYE